MYLALFVETNPKGFKTTSEHNLKDAMKEDILALHQNNTWTLVPHPKSSNVVGSKWVFRMKYNSDGSIDRYKGCLVAQGYT